MDELVEISRWVQVAKGSDGITVEANLWLDERTDGYTVNIRGWGHTTESAARQALIKIKATKGFHR